jgi:arginine/lysine/ornithine decarboxylase
MVAQLERARSIPGEAEAGPDQARAPMLAALARYQATITAPFSAPGHKRGAGASAGVRALLGDAFAADVWLGVADHDPAQREAEDLAAAAWGAERSFFLVNGSSSGTQAFLLATLGPGDEVVVGRDAHQSLLTGLILTGARPVWVMPRLHPELEISLGVAPEDVAAALDAHPCAKLVALTSPTYHGIASDVAGIVAVAHARGVPVYVDEAWGPHFPFHPALPPSAMAAGADGAVTSVHKVLSALRQGALLNVRGPRVDADRVGTTVRMTQTTSPSMAILASLDACRRQLVSEGEERLERAIGLAFAARRRLQALPGVEVLGGPQLGETAFDPTRLVLDMRGLGQTGFVVERTLRERFGVAPAMADAASVVCVLGLGDGAESVDRLVAAVAALAAERPSPQEAAAVPPRRSSVQAVAPGSQACSPREAFFAAGRSVPLGAAVGAVAAEPVTPYPPGIPVLLPGEVVAADKVEWLLAGLAQGMRVRGPADPTLGSLRVVA